MSAPGMRPLAAHIEGIGVLGPGLQGWARTARLLSHPAEYVASPTVLPIPDALPPAERRRTGRVVKLALAVGTEATRMAQVDPVGLPAVFSSSGGDGQNCHEICETLTKEDRELSPTRFHNSVHNAAAGYWSIATGSVAASNALCAFDASFAAGLLEAITQLSVDGSRMLLVAYDLQYPPPLHAKRPIPDAFGVALVLAPQPSPATCGRIAVTFADEAPERMPHSAFEAMRATIPSARSLPMLAQLARGEPGRVTIEYLDGRSLSVEVG